MYGSVFDRFHSENHLSFPFQAVEVVVSNPAATDGVDAEAAIARQKEANRKALAALLDEPQVNKPAAFPGKAPLSASDSLKPLREHFGLSEQVHQ